MKLTPGGRIKGKKDLLKLKLRGRETRYRFHQHFMSSFCARRFMILFLEYRAGRVVFVVVLGTILLLKVKVTIYVQVHICTLLKLTSGGFKTGYKTGNYSSRNVKDKVKIYMTNYYIKVKILRAGENCFIELLCGRKKQKFFVNRRNFKILSNDWNACNSM